MQLTIQQAETALSGLDLATVVSATELAGGSSPVFRLDLADGTAVVLKTYPDHLSPHGEALIAARLRDATALVPRFLKVDATRDRLAFAYAVTEHMPGVVAGSLKGHPDIASLYHQMGGLLRTLHTIEMPAYGFLGAGGIANPFATNQAFMRHLAERSFERFAAFGGDPDLATHLRRIVDDGIDTVVPHSSDPVFAHNDLHPNNVLATETEEGKLVLSGLVDFGNAVAASPLFDLSKSLFCSEHDAPGSAKHILAGYGPLDHPAPDTALAFYTLLHRVIMWYFLRQIGVIATPDTPSELITDLRHMAETGLSLTFL